MTKVHSGEPIKLSQPSQDEANNSDVVEQTAILKQANGINGVSTTHGTEVNGIKDANGNGVQIAKDAISHGEGQVAVPASS